MRGIPAVLAVCLLFNVQGVAAQAPTADRFKIIIQRPNTAGLFSGDFGNGTSGSNLTSLNRTFTGQTVPLEVFSVTAQGDFSNAADLCAYLQSQNPDVQSCDPDVRVHTDSPSATPDDPMLPQLWNLPAIKLDQAWAAGNTGDANVRVCMVDTGIDYTHPDMQANMWMNVKEMQGPGATAANGYQNGIDDDGDGIVDDIYGVNFSNGLNTGDPLDDNGHGSFVAGVVGAVGNNNIGITGVNQAASVMACKFMDDTGNGWVSDAIRCFDWCMSHGAHIMSNSWGGVDYSAALQTAINQTVAQGVLLVASAGNDGYDTDKIQHYPSSLPDATVMAVGASDRFGNLWSGSNHGVKTVHIAAPGVSVTSLGMNNDYIQLTGTSMATPHVSGTAALILGKYLANGFDISTTPPAVGRAIEIKKLMMDSASPFPGTPEIASGLLDVVAALSLVPLNPNMLTNTTTNPFGQPQVITVQPPPPSPNTAINPFSSDFGSTTSPTASGGSDSQATIEESSAQPPVVPQLPVMPTPAATPAATPAPTLKGSGKSLADRKSLTDYIAAAKNQTSP